MLETILEHLHNWFPAKNGVHRGTFRIASGMLEADFLKPGQYYRIKGSIFNDGLHKFGETDDAMTDEAFIGEVWALAIPKAVIKLAGEIGEWNKNNPVSDKISESFDGYSYTRATKADGSASGGWQAAFRSRLNEWKKVG